SRTAEELYGHLEDKLIGYLGGEERLTEADAMILVREHFGRVDGLRSVLADGHAVADVAGASLPPKLVGAAVATGVASIISLPIGPLVIWALSWVFVRMGWRSDVHAAWISWLGWSTSVTMSFVTLGILGWLLRRSHALVLAAKKPWFIIWHPVILAI